MFRRRATTEERFQAPLSKFAKRRENRKAAGDTTTTSQHYATRRLTREKGDFLTLLHLIHIVARQDLFHLRAHPDQQFAFWGIPEVPEEAKHTRKQLGDFLEANLDTKTLTSVELSWGVEYLLESWNITRRSSPGSKEASI